MGSVSGHNSTTDRYRAITLQNVKLPHVGAFRVIYYKVELLPEWGLKKIFFFNIKTCLSVIIEFSDSTLFLFPDSFT